ncbi:L,D-transpeptidase [Thiomicrorhabdus aquaedulcis]|uniref:L,D-transpeptidase n=1 Tax=Thiomicrorhabdus aquaedulcis TaxID=2211106 RepID=UPI0018D5804D|nr:L,D-transpeptidase [Thiomicrorhabdus aquaedulcis]
MLNSLSAGSPGLVNAVIGLDISLSQQMLSVYQAGQLIKTYSVSTAKNGAGSQKNSYKTPLGRHIVRAKIGGGLPINSVLVGRRPTGELYSPQLAQHAPQRDWILTRILWLSGKEPGLNRLGEVDTMQRYIYVHGTPDSEPLGVALSHGCVRMRNADIIELFELTPLFTEVNITV